jgi:DNA-binding transcriptional MerR regulator/effector-binding domain-containing protein
MRLLLFSPLTLPLVESYKLGLGGENLLTVGQLARICNISSKTLRYYDQIGLFTPTAVGEENQYRYYHVGQIELLRRILFLRDLGVGIETIREMKESGSLYNNNKILAILLDHKNRIHKEIEERKSLINKIEKAINTGYQRKETQTPIVQMIAIKEVPSIEVMGARKEIFIKDLPAFTFEVKKGLKHRLKGPAIYLYHNPEFDPDYVDVEVLFPVMEGEGWILPEITAATLIHTGDDSIGDAYAALYEWIYNHGYTYQDPPREIHHIGHDHENSDNTLVIEIQVPIVR